MDLNDQALCQDRLLLQWPWEVLKQADIFYFLLDSSVFGIIQSAKHYQINSFEIMKTMTKPLHGLCFFQTCRGTWHFFYSEGYFLNVPITTEHLFCISILLVPSTFNQHSHFEIFSSTGFSTDPTISGDASFDSIHWSLCCFSFL